MRGRRRVGTAASSLRRAAAAVAVASLVMAGCADGSPESGDAETSAPPTPSATSPASPSDPTPSEQEETPPSPTEPTETATSAPEPRSADPVIEPVPPRQWKRIVEANMARPECPVGRKQLRRVEVNYVTFSGDVRRGVLVVNRDVAESVAHIFTRLFEAEFPIRRMRPLEEYGGDSNASLRDDNTGAFNCRRPSQINAPPKESPHAHGRAIDINPRENPWKDLRCDCWMPGPKNRKREPGPGVIVKGGVVWRTFRSEGWIWQNIDVPDYMHFDTGYPSKPYTRPKR